MPANPKRSSDQINVRIPEIHQQIREESATTRQSVYQESFTTREFVHRVSTTTRESVHQESSIIRGFIHQESSALLHTMRDIQASFSDHARATASRLSASDASVSQALGNNANLIGRVFSRLAEGQAANRREMENMRQALSAPEKAVARDDPQATAVCMVLVICVTVHVYERNLRMAFVCVVLASFLRVVCKLQQARPRQITAPEESTIVLIDALDRRIPIPMEMWETFEVRTLTLLDRPCTDFLRLDISWDTCPSFR